MGSSGRKGSTLGARARALLARTSSGPADDPAPQVLDLELSDAVARAEAAEAEVTRLKRELAYKEEVLADARIALRTARLALRDHLRITDFEP
ncbi:MAG: hypothetical protein HKN24_13295 [Acidimicrobiales bacterium]|nr:hypothetical protein [Acidimicrobiales bacterium]